MNYDLKYRMGQDGGEQEGGGVKVRACKIANEERLAKQIDRVRGDHRQLVHPTKPGTVTVAGHPSDDVHPKTLKSVLRQAGLEKDT